MKQIIFNLVYFCAAFFFFSCSKEKDANGDITVENLSGTYELKALTWMSGSTNVNVYELLDDCEKDNLIRLNVDKTANYIDAGIVCSPPEEENGTWYLSGDSLYLSNGADGGKIKSFDGTTLVLTGSPASDPGVTATTTLQKK
jgi:hypothetical protein